MAAPSTTTRTTTRAGTASPRRKRSTRGPRLVWITNRTVARQLKELDCSLVAVFADIATDKKIDPALRFRAAERLAGLLFGPRMGDRADATLQVDVGAIIAGTWARGQGAQEAGSKEKEPVESGA